MGGVRCKEDWMGMGGERWEEDGTGMGGVRMGWRRWGVRSPGGVCSCALADESNIVYRLLTVRLQFYFTTGQCHHG